VAIHEVYDAWKTGNLTHVTDIDIPSIFVRHTYSSDNHRTSIEHVHDFHGVSCNMHLRRLTFSFAVRLSSRKKA
jgi:hypothetical protein